MMDPTSSTRPRAFGNRGGDRSSPHRKTNRRAMLLALLLGAVAAVLIVFYLGSRAADGDQQEVVPTMEVVVAAREIAAGEEILGRMLQLKALPVSAVINNAATARYHYLNPGYLYRGLLPTVVAQISEAPAYQLQRTVGRTYGLGAARTSNTQVLHRVQPGTDRRLQPFITDSPDRGHQLHRPGRANHRQHAQQAKHGPQWRRWSL